MCIYSICVGRSVLVYTDTSASHEYLCTLSDNRGGGGGGGGVVCSYIRAMPDGSLLKQIKFERNSFKSPPPQLAF